MNINKLTLNSKLFPDLLRHIPQPPEQLYVAGITLSDLMKRPRVAIVGSRTMTPYGKLVTYQIAGQLAELGIVIVSGLAIGVDAVAHQAAIDAGGQTIAVLPSPLDNIVPATNRRLAQAILNSGGTLVSEYSLGTEPHKGNFIERNRLMSGLSDAVLITEAAEKSGSLHTADFALDQGRTVLAVPGNINSSNSKGTNNLLKQGATPVTSYIDVLRALGIEPKLEKAKAAKGATPNEQLLLDLLFEGVNDGSELLKRSSLTASLFNQTITRLEVSGKIWPLGAHKWGIR